MNVNQSSKERIARVIVGLLLLKSGKKLGIIPLVTGATGYCPIKSKLVGKRAEGRNTLGKKCCRIRQCWHKKLRESEKAQA